MTEPRHELGELLVGRVDGELDLAAVEHGVVGAPDRLRVLAADGRQRAAPEPAHDTPDIELELVQLVQRRLDHARSHLDPAGQTRRRREHERQSGGVDAGALGHIVRDRRRRGFARLEAQHRLLGALVDLEVVVELLGADQRPAGPAGDREVAVSIQAPACVLGPQTGQGGVIGDDGQAGQPAAFQHQRCERDRAQAAHADLREATARLEAAGDGAAAIENPRAVGQRRHRHAQGIGLGSEAITSPWARSLTESVMSGPRIGPARRAGRRRALRGRP